MGNRRSLSWNKALSDLKADRGQRSDIREERLKVGATRGMPPVKLSAWRGRSGRRHIVSVHPLEAQAVPSTPAAYLAVRRDAAGMASVAAASHDLSQDETVAWIERAKSEGACELHIHTLSDTPAEREDVIRDVTPVE